MMKLQNILAILLAAVLMFFGIIFLIASVYEITRIITGSILVATGLIILVYVFKINQPVKKYQVELPGDVKLNPITCPNCSASIPVENIKVVSGVTHAVCPHCGHTYQFSEEPKW